MRDIEYHEIVECDGWIEGNCPLMHCSHRGKHKYTNDCAIDCTVTIGGEDRKFDGCKPKEDSIMDVDELFEDIEI